jgi:hypothetical protein
MDDPLTGAMQSILEELQREGARCETVLQKHLGNGLNTPMRNRANARAACLTRVSRMQRRVYAVSSELDAILEVGVLPKHETAIRACKAMKIQLRALEKWVDGIVDRDTLAEIAELERQTRGIIAEKEAMDLGQRLFGALEAEDPT